MSDMRLIDANALEEELSSLSIIVTGLRAGKGVLREYMTEYRKSVLRIVDEAPTVDRESLRPVGYWIHDVNNLYACSECLERETMSPKKKKPFCPNCGARMKGENDGK